MNQSNLLRICRWLGYFSLCLLICSWTGCGGGSEPEPDAAATNSAATNAATTTDAQTDANVSAEATQNQNATKATDGEATTANPPSNVARETVADATTELVVPADNIRNVELMRGFTAFDKLMAALSIFVLAVFVGFEVITKVPPTLHTPLMSGSNAISGITLVGALLVAGRGDYAAWLGVVAVVFAMINVIGGFWVTHRMLSMFKR